MATRTPHEPVGDDTAADVIRDKLDRIYDEEPSAFQELDEAEHVERRSKHQAFMYKLGNSGKDLATIQTEWHNYYQGLPAHEKHAVWQEFYASQSAMTGQQTHPQDPQALAQHKHQASQSQRSKTKRLRDARSKQDIQSAIRDKVTAGGKMQKKHHLQSLLVGVGAGLIALIILSFGFFNEVIIAPFIQPSRTSASTPLIVSDASAPVSEEPKIIIPKINVEIPVDYNQASVAENDIQASLENGIVHYPTTTRPGQTGNAAFFGHSSNNIFNKGKYKFAFVLLHTLEKGDTFYIAYDKKMYVYKVTDKQVVDPTNVGVLNPIPGKNATATLITCDPPGTSLRRLVVVGDQISPDPANNVAAATPAFTPTNSQTLPGNSPTLWSRVVSTTLGKLIVFVAIAAPIILIGRTLYKSIKP